MSFCIICNSESKYMYEVQDSVTMHSFALNRCQTCSLEFLPRQPDDLGCYYDNYIGKGMTKSSRFFSCLQKIAIRKEFKFLKHYNLNFTNACILGSGSGGERAVLEKIYPNVLCADFNPPDRETLRVDINNIDELKNFLKANSIDFISLRHVLEHLRNPILTLQAFKDCNVSCLNIIVPNGDSLFKKIFKNYWSLYDPPRHLFTFNAKNLRTALEKNGYEILTIKYYGFDELFLSLHRLLSLKGIDIPFLRAKAVIPTLASVLFSVLYKGSAVQLVARLKK